MMNTTWVVAYDFSQLAHAALATAADMLSRQGGGRLIVAHAHQLRTSVDGNGIDLALLGSNDLEVAYVKDAERQLAEDVAAVKAPGVNADARVISGRPVQVICGLATDEKASLVVLGSHGRHGLERFFVGSVAEGVVRHSPCAVLIVKQPIGTTAA